MPRNTSGLNRGGPGRKPGIPNKATQEIKEVARRLLEDPDYVQNLKRRLQRGDAGQVEPLLYHYAYGKPKETVALEGNPMAPLIIDAFRPDDAKRGADD